MGEILLTKAIPAHRDLERLNLFAGRHMGEEEFERQQAYMDRRLSPLLASLPPGIVQGLEARGGREDAVGDTVSVNSGLAIAGNGSGVGLYYPLRQYWKTLIEDYLRNSGATSASGVFYLTLNRNSHYVDADPEVDPCQRQAFDPTRDARRLVVGSLGLKRLALPAALSSSREHIENWVAANHVGGEFLRSMGQSVPLGLLAIAEDEDAEPGYSVTWFSQTAGRYRAREGSGYQVLLQQVREAFQRQLLAAAHSDQPLVEYLQEHLRLDFLPAVGELPLGLLRDIASTSPGIGWLPEHLALDMVAVPQGAVNELVERNLARRVVDLRQASGARLRLLLALNERDYTPNILDYPQTDAPMERDVYRYFIRAHDSWRHWLSTFHTLYFLQAEDSLLPETLAALDLPEPVAPPQRPEDFFAQVIADSRVQEDGEESEETPYPYSDGVPDYPAFYRHWGTESGESVAPPSVAEPEKDGLVIQYALAEHQMESLDNQIRALEARLEKSRDYILLQRQQLDNQTVSLSALAGGVAGDGSGLQVARWLPFTQLKRSQATLQESLLASTTADATEPGETMGTTDSGVTLSRLSMTSGAALSQPKYQLAKATMAPLATTGFTAVSTGKPEPTAPSNLVYSSTLRKTPSSFSSLQFNINNRRLQHIAEAPKKALTLPAFETKEFRFGVLEHVQPEVQEYKKAFRGMAELRTTLQGLFEAPEAKAITDRFDRLAQPKTYEELEQELRDELESSGQPSNSGAFRSELPPKIYEAMFDIGATLTKQIAQMESRYSRIEAALEGRLRTRINLEARMEKLLARIREATEELDSRDKRRVEYLGDYGVAQRLLDEDWLNVHERYLERERILTRRVQGLHYVLERQTPISMPLADPLALRYGQSSDPVPGCEWEEDVELPEELDEFFETVLEVALQDWKALKPFKAKLPSAPRLDYLAKLREGRLHAKIAMPAAPPAPVGRAVTVSMAGLRRQDQAMRHQLARRVHSAASQLSLRQRQEQAARQVSLEDLLSGTKGLLHRKAQTLHNRLEQAVVCLLEKLEALPGSLRLQWAQLAEDDRLRVDSVAHWPGLERAERSDFNIARTLVELVAWWFRQLDSEASNEGRAAMRNMLRACLIHAALGDPAAALRGEVEVPPRRLALGEALRLRLNRTPKPGETLQLLDPQQRVVALLNVDDHDPTGTLAKVARITLKNAQINTGYRVVAGKTTQLLNTTMSTTSLLKR